MEIIFIGHHLIFEYISRFTTWASAQCRCKTSSCIYVQIQPLTGVCDGMNVFMRVYLSIFCMENSGPIFGYMIKMQIFNKIIRRHKKALFSRTNFFTCGCNWKMWKVHLPVNMANNNNRNSAKQNIFTTFFIFSE